MLLPPLLLVLADVMVFDGKPMLSMLCQCLSQVRAGFEKTAAWEDRKTVDCAKYTLDMDPNAPFGQCTCVNSDNSQTNHPRHPYEQPLPLVG